MDAHSGERDEDCRGRGEAPLRGVRGPAPHQAAVVQERSAPGAHQGSRDCTSLHTGQVQRGGARVAAEDQPPGGARHRVLHVRGHQPRHQAGDHGHPQGVHEQLGYVFVKSLH